MTSWRPCSRAPALGGGEVHVWLVEGADPDRLARAARRTILSEYLDRDPEALIFETGPWGKPRLAGDELRFNVSHSGSIALIAVSRDRELGIDVERARERIDHDGLARRYFSPAEREAFARMEEVERPRAFLRVWTRKEAYLKARGAGLHLPLDSFDVSCEKLDPRLIGSRADPGDEQRWHLVDIGVPFGYAAALASEGAPDAIQLLRRSGL